jgi:RNA polymerase sigma-70 factor (ECF subfamily)
VLISTTLSKIGDPCYRLLELFYFVQKTMEEISVELGYKNPETTKNQKYKCMERLRKMVEEERSGFQLKSKKTNG